jgi:small subunit ribosomal protein S14
MAKKSSIERELKRQRLVKKYNEKRKQLKKEFKESNSYTEKLVIHTQIQKLPRNSAPIRVRRRCWKTGRSRAVFRDFGVCRHMLREMGLQGLIPGLIKSSW